MSAIQNHSVHISVYIRVKPLYIILLFISTATHAQVINNAVSYRSIKQTHYVRHDYENDYFTASDKLYTQGINMEVVTAKFKKLPTSYILLHPSNSSVQYGLSLQHNAYTPTMITDPNIRLGDRPYGSAAMLQAFTISTNKNAKQRITTMLSIGVMGQIAGGQWMQETIHRNTENVMPVGWQYQIANDAIVNYRFFYEKCIVQVDKVLEVNTTAIGDLGLLHTKAGVGLNMILGYFESSYNDKQNRKLAAYIYGHIQGYTIGYDAMLQGGLLNRSSVYTIPTDDVERLTADCKTGFVFRYGGLYLEYFRAQRTREFKTGDPHAWGGVMIGVGF